MSGKYQAYPEYKDSGVEWLGRVPQHWRATQTKYGYTIVLGKMLQTVPKTDMDLLKPYLRAANIQPHGLDLDDVKKMWFSPNERLSLRLEAGDVLISEGGDVGRSAIWQSEIPECYIQNAVNRARSHKSNVPSFLNYWLKMIKASGFIDIICNKSTIPHYTAEKVEATPILLPPPEEQRTIATFLDHETARIDRLIEKQQRLIELLKEKRQAVISHAVTKGLDPNVPMKDSGVEWLGQVPEHWTTTKLKYECAEIVDCLHSTPAYDADGVYPAIRTADISPGVMDVAGARRVTEEVYQDRNIRLKPQSGDIIYSREGERYGMAACIPTGSDVCLGQRVMLFQPLKSAEFMMWALNSNSCYKQAQQDVIGSTAPHVNVETIKNFDMAWPPHDERELIATFVTQTTRKLDRLMGIATDKVALLQESRTALISAAVTGKIDVRNWQPNTSTQSDEPDLPMAAEQAGRYHV